MAAPLVYTRKFFILKKELATTEQKNQKGHGKIELKGLRGSVLVNIENAEVDESYKVALIANDKSNNTWDLGKIFTDNMGRGKNQYSFIFKELETKDFSVDKIRGILIMKDEEIFLAGYIDNDDGSIEQYVQSLTKREEIEYFEEHIELDESYDIIEESANMSVDEDLIECKDEDYRLGVFEDESIDEQIVIEATANEQPSEIEATEEIKEETAYVDIDTIEEDYKTSEHLRRVNQKNKTVDYVLSILRFFPYIDPFKNSLYGYNWWMVELDKENEYRSFLPYFSYITGGNSKESYSNKGTACNQLIEKYQHYLFGLYNEEGNVKYFVYGIPGEFTLEQQPYKGENGFNTWYEGQNIKGYWIIYIDPLTGKAIKLINPMIPVE